MDKYKLCPTCGAKNPPYKTECECETDLIKVKLTDENDEIQNQGFTLSAINDNFIFIVTKPVHVLGRTNDMGEYLSAKAFVSGTHATLSVENNELTVTDMGSTNGTFVNGEKIQKDTPFKLKNGDVVSLGGKKLNGAFQEKAAAFVVGSGD